MGSRKAYATSIGPLWFPAFLTNGKHYLSRVPVSVTWPLFLATRVRYGIKIRYTRGMEIEGSLYAVKRIFLSILCSCVIEINLYGFPFFLLFLSCFVNLWKVVGHQEPAKINLKIHVHIIKNTRKINNGKTCFTAFI